jgi:uncharacterized integral membrane protein
MVPSEERGQLARLVLAIVVVVILVAFILGNREEVRFSFVVFHSRIALIWALLVTNLLGFVAGYLFHGRMELRRSRPKA